MKTSRDECGYGSWKQVSMLDEQQSVNGPNPYQPPTSVNEQITGALSSFRVGINETITVFIEASIWTGIKTYVRDAEGNAGPVYRGSCEFEVGKVERHQITVAVDNLASVNAYVDGQLVEANIFARLRIRIFSLVVVFIFVVSLSVTALGVFLFKPFVL